MTQVFAPINYFKHNNILDSPNLSNGELIADGLNDEEIKRIGLGLYEDIKHHIVIHKELNESTIKETLIHFNLFPHEVNSEFLFYLWIVKDHSCYVCMTFVKSDEVDENTIAFNQSFVKSSKSNGEHSDTVFEVNDLEKALEYASRMKKLRGKSTSDTVQATFDLKGYFERKPVYEDLSVMGPIDIMMTSINEARSSGHLVTKISHYIVALESIYAQPDEKDNLTFKLSYRVPIFLGGTPDEKESIHQIVKNGYNIRSKSFHGSRLSKNTANDSYLTEVSVALDNMLRSTILTIIYDDNKREILFDKKLFQSFFHNIFIGNVSNQLI